MHNQRQTSNIKQDKAVVCYNFVSSPSFLLQAPALILQVTVRHLLFGVKCAVGLISLRWLPYWQQRCMQLNKLLSHGRQRLRHRWPLRHHGGSMHLHLQSHVWILMCECKTHFCTRFCMTYSLSSVRYGWCGWRGQVWQVSATQELPQTSSIASRSCSLKLSKTNT